MKVDPSTPATAETAPSTAQRILLVDLYNPAGDWAAKCVVALLGSTEPAPTWMGWANELPDGRFPTMRSLVRAHEFQADLAEQADVVLFFYRDVRDALASIQQYLKVQPTFELAANLIETAQSWEQVADLSLRFETIRQRPEEALQQIATALSLPTTDVPLVASMLVTQLTPDPDADDCVHVPIGAYRNILAKPIADAIKLGHGAWLEAHGYTCNEKPGPSTPALAAVPGFEDDQAKLLLLQKLGFTPGAIVDVGASNGPWSWTCAKVFPDSKYFLFEALPQYSRNLMVPNDRRQWHYHSLALGPTDGEIAMTVPEGEHGCYGSSALEFGKPMGQTVAVQQRRIDGLLAEGQLSMPDLVKIDVQGYELHVLSGAEQLWGNTEVFIIETSLYRYWKDAPSINHVINYFDARGYCLFDIAGEFRARNGSLSQLDLIFVKKKGRLVSSMGVQPF